MNTNINRSGDFNNENGGGHQYQKNELLNNLVIKNRNIEQTYGVLGRQNVVFNRRYLLDQPFIPRSKDEKSIQFLEKYYDFTCGSDEYEAYGFNSSYERSSLNKQGINYICRQIGINNIKELAIYPLLEHEQHWGEYIRPTHDLICQMALMSNYGNSCPIYLSASHLGEGSRNKNHFLHYINRTYPKQADNIIPSQEGFVNLMIGICDTLQKNTPSRFYDVSISYQELALIGEKYNLKPLGLYLEHLHDNFAMIALDGNNNFTITATGAIFLYMCNPSSMYVS